MKRYILTLAMVLMFVGCDSVVDVDNTITDTEFKISLKNNKFNHNTEGGKVTYRVNELVSLEVKVSDQVNVDSYTWKEGDKVIGTASKLDREFSLGSHAITVDVAANNSVKSLSFIFYVSDEAYFVTKKLGAREDEVLVDTTYNLMWVSDSDESKEACLAVHEANLTKAKTLSQNFCKNIDFGEFPVGSWRAPTPNELSSFIIETVKADILPAYYKECNILFADENGSSKVVTTRYGVKNEIEILDGDPGSSRNAKLGEALVFRTHYGIRCVRTIN